MRANYKPPPFPYTGPLRPHYVSPMRTVPDHIQKPDYAVTGIPESERLAKKEAKIPIYTKVELRAGSWRGVGSVAYESLGGD